MSSVDDNLLDEMIAHFHYPLGSIVEHAGKLSIFCRYFIDVNLSLSASQINRYRSFIDRLEVAKQTNVVKQSVKRKDLHSQLQEHPFFSTVSLLPDVSQQNAETQDTLVLYALLAHLCSARGLNDYAACLQFYNAFLKADSAEYVSVNKLQAKGITTQFALDSTLLEMQCEMNQMALKNNNKTLDRVVRYFQPPQHRRVDFAALRKKSIIDTPNTHTSAPYSIDGADIALVQTSDENGREIGGYWHVTPDLNRSQSQREQSYRAQQTGISNALRKNELALPFALSSASTGELRLALAYISQSFVSAEYHDVRPQDASILLYFMLKLLTLNRAQSIRVQNLGAQKNTRTNSCASDSRTLRYEYDKKRTHIFAQLILPAVLISTSSPIDEYLYDASQNSLTLNLPSPIGTLLNIVFRNESDSSKRNNTELLRALRIDESDYRDAINKALSQSGLKKRGITRQALEKTFFHYAREKVPETFLNFLKNNASVQNHYVNVSNKILEDTVKSAWSDFMTDIDLAASREDTHESTKKTCLSSYAEDDRVGSVRCVKDEALELLYEQLLKTLSQQVADKAIIDAFNNITLYTYIRLATTVALRPAAKPFPEPEQFDQESGLLSVRDKRVHHKEERRLVVLTDNLCQLLHSTSTLCDELSVRFSIKRPPALVMLLDMDESQTLRWQHLSKTRVDKQLKTIIDDALSSQSFRHVAANSFLNASLKNFSQASLDGFMNHSRAGAALLSKNSLFDIRHMVEQQRAHIKPDSATTHANDKSVLNIMRRFSKVAW